MTYAAHHFARPADTMADMRALRLAYLAAADDADFNNEPGVAVMWEDMAKKEEINIALREDAERRFAASRVPVHVFGEEIPDQREGTGAAAYTFGAVLIGAGITMGIPAVCWLWQTLGGVLS